MSLFSKLNKNKAVISDIFNKDDVISDIFKNKNDQCPGWNFFFVQENWYPEIMEKINGDFIAIFDELVNKEIRFRGSPFTEYTRVVQSTYQIVREIYITDTDIDILGIKDFPPYKYITAASAKELFIKLRKEQENQ